MIITYFDGFFKSFSHHFFDLHFRIVFKSGFNMSVHLFVEPIRLLCRGD